MKKLTYLLAAFILVFTTACDPMEDVYEEIGNTEEVITGDAVYEVTDDDYDDLGLNFGSFNSIDEVKTMLPAILSAEYPVWGEGSTALTHFKLYVGRAFDIDEYTLTQEDYTASGSDLFGFTSDQKPEELLPGILASNMSGADEGDYVMTQYAQYTGDAYTITPSVEAEDNFDYGDTAGDLLTASAGAWLNHSGTDNQLQYVTTGLSMDDYPTSNVGGAIALSSSGSEDVNTSIGAMNSGKAYYSALINISEANGGTYFMHFMEADGSFAYIARVGARTDGSGGVQFGIGASSSSLTYSTESFSLNTTYLVVASYDFGTGTANLFVLDEVDSDEPETPTASNTGGTGYTLERIGIRQGGGGPSATIDGIRAANTWGAIMTNDPLDDIVIGDKSSYEVSYVYEGGNWEETGDNFYALTSEDYDSMGEASGQPGRYNNFDSNIDPDVYIPIFLGQKYPYAMDEDVMDISYKYYSGGVQVRGNRYTFMNGMWMPHTSVIESSLQFGHDGNTWVPDNTIKYTVTGSDIATIDAALSGKYPGPCANVLRFGSFDRRSGSSNYWSDDMLIEAWNVVLDDIHPGAEEGQKYVVNFVVYIGSLANESMKVIKSGGVWVAD